MHLALNCFLSPSLSLALFLSLSLRVTASMFSSAFHFLHPYFTAFEAVKEVVTVHRVRHFQDIDDGIEFETSNSPWTLNHRLGWRMLTSWPK